MGQVWSGGLAVWLSYHEHACEQVHHLGRQVPDAPPRHQPRQVPLNHNSNNHTTTTTSSSVVRPGNALPPSSSLTAAMCLNRGSTTDGCVTGGMPVSMMKRITPSAQMSGAHDTNDRFSKI